MTEESAMNTRVIDHLESLEGFSRLRIRAASRMVSPIRRFKNTVELSDWDERILRHSREIDIFCWMLAGGTAVLLLPICFLVLKG
jgi:hypothetical protein